MCGDIITIEFKGRTGTGPWERRSYEFFNAENRDAHGPEAFTGESVPWRSAVVNIPEAMLHGCVRSSSHARPPASTGQADGWVHPTRVCRDGRGARESSCAGERRQQVTIESDLGKGGVSARRERRLCRYGWGQWEKGNRERMEQRAEQEKQRSGHQRDLRPGQQLVDGHVRLLEFKLI